MAIDTSTLDSIFHMIQPADLLGAQKLSLANKSVNESVLKSLLNVLYNMHGNGAFELVELQKELDNLATKVKDDSDALKQFQRLIHLYSTEGTCKFLSKSQNMALGSDGKEPIDNVTFDQIVGKNNDLKGAGKRMGVLTCNSGFISPMVRNAELVEMFLNFIPSIHASRMVPLMEVEFEFNRGVPSNDKSQPRFWSPSLMKFLMGGDGLNIDKQTPTGKMLELREAQNSDKKRTQTTAGMELFTTPQLLVNPSVNTESNNGRYVDVLDPFRPLMTIESFTINVSPTVGLYSYKKATLTVKLHDRSRLSEIADLIRPQVYQDALSAPTVWVTYGWRYPAEPGNPYADFINGNMLVRESYGIINSEFSFDQTGQVVVTLNLWTKGISELRTANINQDGSIAVINDLKNLAKAIKTHLIAKGVNFPEGVNKEIRSTMVLEAAERGAYPDMKKEEITKAINDLKASLKSPNPKVDAGAFETLKRELGQLDKTYLDFQKTIESQTSDITAKHFIEVIRGPDPFLPFSAKDAKLASETKKDPHPLTEMIEAYNRSVGNVNVKDFKSIIDSKSPGGFRRKLVSLGKLVSVFFANTFKHVEGFDELQLFFYQFNELAGKASGTNIAEFPIEMNVFLDQYREHIERKGSERITLEEFLQLVFDAQVNDPRAIGYGFGDFYAPYDPANKHDVKLAKGKTPEDLLRAHGNFQMPAPSIYVETTFAAEPSEGSSSNKTSIDQLKKFELQKLVEGGVNLGRERQYVRIMRIHIFDKANNPYKLPAKLLSGDDDTNFKLAVDEAKKSPLLKSSMPDLNKQVSETWKMIIKNLKDDARLDTNGDSKISNDEIKKYVSKMVPTIIYGSNASTVVSANLASKQDPLLATTQMQSMSRKAGKPSVLSSNGTDVGGLPLRIIPASMSMTTMGCPLFSYAQIFFVDFNSGTTIDNLYNLTGITHTISPGKFETQLTLTFADAYGKFFGTHQRIFDYFSRIDVK